MRLGVMGGTFDPIHLGHLRAAELARESLGLDTVWFVPARRPPHRDAPDADSLDRYAMVALATAGHPAFVPSDLELHRDGPSFTVDTVAAVREAWPDAELNLIVGSDTYREIGSWREPGRLLELCRVAVVARPDDPAPPDAVPAGVVRVAGTGMPVSATLVRGLARDGRSLRFLVPDPVAEYVTKRRLYR